MITPQLKAEIRRLYYGEHWKVGTISSELAVHHDTVARALSDAPRGGIVRPVSSTATATSSATP